MTALLRLPAVIDRTGLRKTAIYRRVRTGLLPTPIKLGPRASVWPASEIDACNRAIIEGRSEAEIRQLVKDLVANRRG